MNDSIRRPLKLWAVCATFLPILAACSAGPGDSVANGDTETVETQTVADPLDTDLHQVAAKLDPTKALAVHVGLPVTVTLTNGAHHPIRLLKWHTAAEGVHEPIFIVTRDGTPVDYVGRHYKRGAPRLQDYVILAPGESLTHSVDLADSYDLTASGNYKVRFLSNIVYANTGIVSNDVDIWADGHPKAPVFETEAAGQAPSFSGGCTASEKSQLTTALNNASNYANGALTYLSGTPGSKPRYATWFGAYSSSRWSTAKSHFTKIKDAYDTKKFVLDCSCTDDYYAYVYANQPYKIYACNAFWSASATGTDSKAGTLVHETSHFTVVAGTDDRAYGKSACRSLASSNPTGALDNADSHEYFAENTPAQN